jgi:HSP90 family molecular chaperone
VSDNGHGLPFDEAITAFENLGGSWKRAKRTKGKKRQLHGQAGRGRFRAFAIGAIVEWTTWFKADSTIKEYRITGNRQNLGTFTLTDPSAADRQKTGTDVLIRAIDKNFRSLAESAAVQLIAEHFALYLREHPDVTIVDDGTEVDPSTVEEHVREYSLPDITADDGTTISAVLTIIEWRAQTERILYLCNEHGIAMAQTAPGIQAPGLIRFNAASAPSKRK